MEEVTTSIDEKYTEKFNKATEELQRKELEERKRDVDLTKITLISGSGEHNSI